MSDRDKNMNLRVSAEELEMLRELAERAGLTASDYLRQYIRSSHAAHFGAKRKGKK